MASEAQIAANRRNALMSTGPKSRDGKKNSRLNALRHGLAARHVVAMDEHGADFAAYYGELMAALSPQDAFEAALARRLALLSWRLDRLCRIEAVKLSVEYDWKKGQAGRADNVWPEAMPALARYESALDRAFKRTLSSLERRQALRRHDAGGGAPAAHILILPNEPNSGPDAAASGVAVDAHSESNRGDGGVTWRSDP